MELFSTFIKSFSKVVNCARCSMIRARQDSPENLKTSSLSRKKWPKPPEGTEIAQDRGQICTQHVCNSFHDFLCDHINGFEYLILLVPILNCLPHFQERTTAEFLALGSGHNCPSIMMTVILCGKVRYAKVQVNRHRSNCKIEMSSWSDWEDC